MATFTIGVTPEPWEVLTYPGVFVALSFPEPVVDAVPLASSHINAGRKGNVLLVEAQQASAGLATPGVDVFSGYKSCLGRHQDSDDQRCGNCCSY